MAKRKWLRWLVPLGVLAAALTVPTFGARVAADPSDPLPPRSAQQLLVDLQKADVPGFSGTVVEQAQLGLPVLPGLTDSGSGFAALINGEHTAKVWTSGPDQHKVALLEDMGETDLVVNGTDAWRWSSANNTATHWTLKPGTSDQPAPPPPAYTPDQVATALLGMLDQDSTVTTDGTASVADRAAYDLTIAPRSADSLIEQVQISIDGQTKLPLRVQVFARGHSDPAVDVSFTAINFSVPDPSVFTFSPPPGAKVTQGHLPGAMGRTTPDHGRSGAQPQATTVGSGWTSVLVVTLPQGGPADDHGPQRLDDHQLGAILNSLPKVDGSWGSGRLLRSSLLSVLITEDGRILAGAVRPEVLYDAAS